MKTTVQKPFQQFRIVEQARAQRLRTAGQRLMHTLKHADQTAKEIVRETLAEDVAELAKALEKKN